MSKPSGQDKLDQITMPIFSEEMGTRLALVRMKMLLDQGELGDLLGISQQQVSKLEAGRLEYAGFTLARFKAVFAKYYTFILFGSQVGSDNWGLVRKRYLDTRFRIRRKPGSGAWKKDNSAGVELQKEQRAARIDLAKQSENKGS